MLGAVLATAVQVGLSEEALLSWGWNRYGGFSIGYSMSAAAFGGTAPLVITALIDGTGDNDIPAFSLMGAAAIAIIPILLMPEPAKISISHPTEIPGRMPEPAAV